MPLQTMQRLSKSIALAMPFDKEDMTDTAEAVELVRSEELVAQVRIGVGPLAGAVPARVLAYADLIASTYLSDLPKLIGPAEPDIKIFSSAPKSGSGVTQKDVAGLAALGGALRMNGIKAPISLEIAQADQEVPASIKPSLPHDLDKWMTERAQEHSDGTHISRRYGVEHSGNSMFADLSKSKVPPFIVTLGGATEARFWALRSNIRTLARHSGIPVSPGCALILKAIRRPWYYPTEMEPKLLEMFNPDIGLQAMQRAANPTKQGNSGLKSEARALKRAALLDGLPAFAQSFENPRDTREFLMESSLDLGSRLTTQLEEIR